MDKGSEKEQEQAGSNDSWLVSAVKEVFGMNPPELARNQAPFADKANPTSSIRPEGVRQGDINDCYFASSLASVAQTHPDLIKDAIKQNSDGSFDVRFKGFGGETIRVPALTKAEADAHFKITEHGAWAPIMEKAFGTFLKQHPELRSKFLSDSAPKVASGADPAAWADGGGRASYALELLTGYPASGVPIRHSGDTEASQSALTDAMETPRKAVVAGIATDNPIAQSAGLLPGHEYSVLNYNKETKELTLRDPYGAKHPALGDKGRADSKGIIKMNLAEFTKIFDELIIAKHTSPGAHGLIMMNKPNFKALIKDKK